MVKNGALRLFRIAGVDVYIHWSWVIIIYIFSSGGSRLFSSPLWIALDLLCYIAMVALHESVQLMVGRMVGGNVSEMIITFLGRNSNMELPQRPWPIIITYSAGILAYFMMFGATITFFIATHSHGWGGPNAEMLSTYMLLFNIILLAWAAAPVYPLDCGKVLQAVLWLFMSRKRSLQVACILGIPVSLAMIAIAIYFAVVGQSYLLVVWTVLIFFQCLNGFRVAKAFDILEKIPRRTDVACPHCKQHPFNETYIRCPCGMAIDPFQTRGLCPHCGSSTALLACPICRQRSPIHQWFGAPGGFEVQSSTPRPVIQVASAQVVPQPKPPVPPAPAP